MDKFNDKRRPAHPSDAAPCEGASGGRPVLGDHLHRWFLLAHHLVPLIGERGFCTLYGRAVRMTLPEFDWLSADPSCTVTNRLFSGLRENLASVPPETAHAANRALLTTFTTLLSSLIGEALTHRLLASVQDGEPEQIQHRSVTK